MADQHLNPDTIEQLIAGRLSLDEAAAAQSHLESCPACSTVAESARQAGGSAEAPVESESVARDKPRGFATTQDVGDVPPTTDLSSAALAAVNVPTAIGRFQVLGEVARGGMGVVVRCLDADFGRMLAIKISLAKAGDSGVEQRFWNEARITGKLQHPGIPPVHELGQLDDGRPYFVMKLIAGRTLHQILSARKTVTQDLPALIGIFEQVCQTLAYAHAEQIIHRDLKPPNIMVGAFGEVQVMDWGLGKVLDRHGRPSQSQDGEDPTSLAVHRTDSASDVTLDGSILGTPAYMAREQARGEIADVDKASDVFGLGAILCQILTGLPPYSGRSAADVLAAASRGETAEALQRLDKCSADSSLIELAKRCLATDRDDRPADASVVADAIRSYQEQVAERLRQTELKQAQVEIQIKEERKRRRLWLSLGTSAKRCSGSIQKTSTAGTGASPRVTRNKNVDGR